MIAGVLTANELALLRTRPQRTLLYLAIPDYKTIYTARANGAPATNDKIISAAFDGGVGTLANVLPGMTLLVGSAAGLWDIGIARVRDDPLDSGGGAGTFFIGVTSEIEWADDLYLTVLDDYGLWPKHPRISAAGVVYMDYDVAYTNQNVYGDPVPIMSTHAVVELVGGSATVNFDASDTYNCIGAPDHYDYKWYVDNVLMDVTDAVDLTFTTVGTYAIRLEVTADYAIGSPVIEKTSVAVRYVIVHDCEHPLNSSFVLDSCSGSFSEGGWSYRVTMNAKASESYVRDRTLCLLVARDWYGDTEQSIGPLDDRENIVCVGWVDGESIRRSNDKSTVSFEVQGPHYWLQAQEGFPTGVDDTDAAPTDWMHIEELDPRKGLFSFLHWRTTSTVVMDCWITSDNHRLATTYTPAGSLYEQLRAVAERVNAQTVCDRYGRLFCEIDTQFVDPVSRTFAVVQTLFDKDWRDEIMIERRTVGQAGQVDLSGVHYTGDLTTSTAIFSLAPGHYPAHYGGKRKVERIALDDQAEANNVAGLWMGYFNNEYPNVDTPLSSNHRGIDIAPRTFVQMNLAAGDTPRELVWTNKKLIPREVSFNYDQREAIMLTDVTFESETFASDAVTGDPPIEPPDPPDPPTPPTMCNDPLALNFGGYAPCVYPAGTDLVVVMTKGYLAYSVDVISNVEAGTPNLITWTDVTPAGLANKIFDFVISDLGECWISVVSAHGDAFEGIWYSSDISAGAGSFSRILSTATAMAASGGSDQDFNQYSLCMVGGECYASLRSNSIFGTGTNTWYYWHGNGAMALGSWLVTPPNNNINRRFTFCTDGSNAWYAGGGFGVGAYVVNMVDGTKNYTTQAGDGLGGSETYVTCNTSGRARNFVTDADVYLDVDLSRPVAENGADTFWPRITSAALMKNAAVFAVANDAGGLSGVFSSAGSSPGGHSYGVISDYVFWAANTAHASNNRRDLALTIDGGTTWNDIAGDWGTAVAAYDGGTLSMYVEIKWVSV